MSKNLFDDCDSDSNEDNSKLKTNENYAKTYNNLRKKEILQKFKGQVLDTTESDDSDSSEDDAVNPSFDKEFLKTLASLKSKDPSIYDKNKNFFEKEESDSGSVEEYDEEYESNIHRKKKSRPVTLKDYERKIILDKGGKFVDDSDEDGDKQTFQRPLSPTLVEEEIRLKAEFKKVMNQDDDLTDEEFGGIFKRRQKTEYEKDREEEDYLKWLAGKKESIGEDVEEKLGPLKNYWGSDKLPPSEKFLRDYVLNKGYTEATNYNEIPTYEEIVGDQAPLSEDEEELEKQAEFEQKYNFRYEEPDQEFIKRYPRTIETSLRITDEKRKKKRIEIKQRKLQEKEQKLKELEVFKELKRKEIQEKIEKLKIVTGNDKVGFNDDDLEEDFDPEAHDRRMQELFNDDYYEVDEGEEKPECPSDMEELKVEDWDNYDPQQDEISLDCENNEPHCEDEDFIMDCDYDPVKAKEDLQKELIENTKKRRSGRKGRRDRFKEIIKSEKPVFDPEDEKTYGEYIDEYYKLDCEDVIGDIPCRFKYVETTPNDFGLSIEEILLAKNKELNQWASLKKAIQIRPNHVEKKEQRIYKLKAKNDELKRKIFKSLYGEGSDNENDDLEMETENRKNAYCNESILESGTTGEKSVQEQSKKSKKKRKRKAQNNIAALQTKAGDELDMKEKNDMVKHQNIEEDSVKTLQKKESTHESNGFLTAEIKTQLNKKVKKNKSDVQKCTANKKNHTYDKGNFGRTQINNNLSNNLHMKKLNVAEQMNDTINKKAQRINHSSNDVKPITKNNPFAKDPSEFHNSRKQSIGSLPPLRKNQSKVIKINNKSKFGFKSKNPNKKQFKGKSQLSFKEDSKEISDERLKAYGINPKRYHKKQKYSNDNQ